MSDLKEQREGGVWCLTVGSNNKLNTGQELLITGQEIVPTLHYIPLVVQIFFWGGGTKQDWDTSQPV